TLDRRTVPRAFARLLLPQRRLARALLRERRLDGTQLLPPDRGRLPDRRSGPPSSNHRGARALSGRQHASVGAAERWRVSAAARGGRAGGQCASAAVATLLRRRVSTVTAQRSTGVLALTRPST